jgi:protein-L-isoaspartate(D-aspartate) O-methyltransferase
MKRCCSIILLALVLQGCSGSDSFVEQRKQMVTKQIKWRGITNQQVINAMLTVPREEFVLPAYRSKAYQDIEVPIGGSQTLDRPYEDALILDSMNINQHSKVLEVGTGSGYLAALISEIAREVYTIEIEAAPAAAAKKLLSKLGYKNVTVRHADGFIGWKERAPFDSIVLTCSPDHVPAPLVEQLREGGRIILPLGGEKKFQELLLYTKANGELKLLRRLAPANFSPMKGKIKEDK